MNKIVKKAIEETNKEIDSEGNFVGGPTSIRIKADTIQGAIDEGRQITNKDLLKDKIEQTLPSQISLKKYEKELERKGLPKDEPGLQDGEDGNIEIDTYDIETLEDLRSTMNPTQKKEFNTKLGEAKDAGKSSFTYNVKLNPAGTMSTEKTSTQKGPMSKQMKVTKVSKAEKVLKSDEPVKGSVPKKKASPKFRQISMSKPSTNFRPTKNVIADVEITEDPVEVT